MREADGGNIQVGGGTGVDGEGSGDPLLPASLHSKLTSRLVRTCFYCKTVKDVRSSGTTASPHRVVSYRRLHFLKETGFFWLSWEQVARSFLQMSPGTDIQSPSSLFIVMLMSCRLMLLFCGVRPSLQ